MTEKESNKNLVLPPGDEVVSREENSQNDEGYLTLQVLSEKYGYAKDYLGWLSRTGRIEAVRHGKYGKWHALEESLKRYQLSLIPPVSAGAIPVAEFQSVAVSGSKPKILPKKYSFPTKKATVSIGRELEKSNVPPVLLLPSQPTSSVAEDTIVLFKNDGSYSADSGLVSPEKNPESPKGPERKNPFRRVNAILTFSIVLGGILFFIKFYPVIDLDIIKTPVLKVSEILKNKIRSALDIKPGEKVITVVLPQATPSGPISKIFQTITKELTITKKVDDKELSDINKKIIENQLRISLVEQSLSNINFTPTIFQLPSSNTGGIGPITLNPNRLESETLNVTGSSTLGSLTVLNDFTVDTNTFYVNSTDNRVGIGTTTPTTALDVVGSVAVSANFEVAGFASASQTFGSGLSDCDAATDTLNWDATTGKFSCGTDGGGGSVSSNSLDFDEMVNTMTLDSNLTINRGTGNFFIGVGSAPSTVFEVQGTASASYLLTGNTLQVGGFASAAYSRFGTSTLTTNPAGNWITGSNDLLISGDLYGVGSIAFAGPASISNTLFVGTGGKTGNVGIGTTVPGEKLEVYFGLIKISSASATDNDSPGIVALSNDDFLYDGDYLNQYGLGWHEYDDDTNEVVSGSKLNAYLSSYFGIDLFTHGVNRIRVNANGNVGIGTTIPTSLLTVQGRGEFQGTASASYLLTGNTLQVGGFASKAFSRFGTNDTTSSFLSTSNDLLITGRLEVDGKTHLDSNASISGNIWASGYASSSTFFGSGLGDCDQETQTLNWDAGTGKFSCLADGGSSVASNSLGFGALVNNMRLDASGETGTTVGFGNNDFTFNLDGTGDFVLQDNGVTRFVFTDGGLVGVGTATPQTLFEVQGTASASYLLTGNTLQVGGFSSVAYSRFGTSTTGHSNYISTTNDLLVSGDLEVDGSISAQFASVSQMFVANNTASASAFFRGNGSGGTNQSNFSIGVGNGTERLNIFNDTNSPIVTIASTGNVGIGTTAPSSPLHIVTSESGGGAILHQNTNTTGYEGFNLYDNSGNLVTSFNHSNSGAGDLPSSTFLGTRNAEPLYFVTNGVLPRMTIDSTGNVGINTTAPSTKFEVQGTASASYLLTGNTLQVGGYASAAYSRFGTGTTNKSNYITQANDVLISGDLEVFGTGSFNIASASVFWLPGTSGARLGDCDAANDTLNWDAATGKFVCGSDGGGSIASNSLGFGALVNNMRLDASGETGTTVGFGNNDFTFNLDGTGDFVLQDNGVTRFVFTDGGLVGVGTATPQTLFEVQGTASASYLLTGNTLQVGGFSSAAYSRFGTGTTGYTNFITTTNDLLISGDLEVDATAQFDSFVRISNNNTRAFVITDTGGARQDIFTVDTTASSSNSGIIITAGPSQTGALLELKSSGDTMLTKFSDEGGLFINIASTSAVMVTSPTFPVASITFKIDTLNGETRVSALSTKSLGFEVFGIASVSNTLLVGPTKFDPIASVSKFFGKGGVWVTGALCVDDGETSATDCGDANRAAGTIYSSNASVDIGDLAENFPTLDEDMEAGDLVALDYRAKPIATGSLEFESEFVKKASSGDVIMGIISKKPGLLLKGSGSKDKRSVQNVAVALSGRVPVKVSNENGNILPGDRLTASSVAGIAMKAVEPGQVVGIALEPFVTASSGFDNFGNKPSLSFGQTLTFVNLTFWVPDLASTASTSVGFDDGASLIDPLVKYIADKFKNALGIIFEKGLLKIANLITDKLTTKELCLEEVCITKDQLKSLLYQNAIPASSTNSASSPQAGSGQASTPSPTPVSDSTGSPQATPTPTDTSIPSPELTPTPTPSASSGPTASPSATVEPTLESTPTPETSPSPTPTPIPTPEPTPQTTPAPTTPEPIPTPPLPDSSGFTAPTEPTPDTSI